MTKSGCFTKDVCWELDVYWHRWDLIPILNIDWHYRPKGTDHRGVYFGFAMWKFHFEFNIYSPFHADYVEES